MKLLFCSILFSAIVAKTAEDFYAQAKRDFEFQNGSNTYNQAKNNT